MLEQIATPSDLKALPASDLPALADELRTHIIDSVAAVGGHLGSNLGAVELTMALHRVFDSPNDVMLWDTGHQAYVHKMLTGRTAQFGTLRQAGGLSGYPSRNESEHDLIENSHASTALSWAYGIAEGFRAAGTDSRRVIAVVGDGALTGGMAYEALNNIGHNQTPVTILLNDNGRSYAETISRLSAQVSRVRMDPRYRTWRDRLDNLIERIPYAEKMTESGLRGIKQYVSDAPALQNFVEALGVRYLGPVDGHDVAAMEQALESTKRMSGPVLVHVLTEKGRGYEPAETDPEKKLHDTSAFDPETGEAASPGGRKWTAAFSDVLCDLADEEPRIVAITAAMPGSTGLLPLARRYPDRVIDVGIAEQHAVTAAAGLAHTGRIPVVAVYSTFFARAFDQANLDVGLHDEHVVFVFDRAGITGPDGASHHGVLDMVLSLRIPAMTVLTPSSEQELAVLLREAIHLEGPVTVRFPRGRSILRDEVGSGLAARRVREGADVTILSVGDRLDACVEAAQALESNDIDAAVWDVRCVRPLDPALVEAAAASPLVVTVENGYRVGGAGTYIADRVQDLAGVRSAPPVLSLGTPDKYLDHGSPDRILAELGLDAAGITASIRKALTD